LFDTLKIENIAASPNSFQFQKRGQQFIGVHNETPFTSTNLVSSSALDGRGVAQGIGKHLGF
jgi:hypothetical protein